MSARALVVLASQSPARAWTLRNAGVEPFIQVSDVDEDAVLASFASPASADEAERKVCALARAKARAVASSLDSAALREFASRHDVDTDASVVVIGCDSMLEVGGDLLGKPHDPQVAKRRIRDLSGATVTLHTGHHLIVLSDGVNTEPSANVKEVSGSEATLVHFTEMSEAEINAYVATGEPLNVAGAFTIDGLGGAFIRGVTGDPHSVVGLSLPLARRLASDLGVFWPDTWNRRRGAELPPSELGTAQR